MGQGGEVRGRQAGVVRLPGTLGVLFCKRDGDEVASQGIAPLSSRQCAVGATRAPRLRRRPLLWPRDLPGFSRRTLAVALSATGPTFARNSFSWSHVSVSMACLNDSHFTALTSRIGSRSGPPTAHMCQNCTILMRPSIE